MPHVNINLGLSAIDDRDQWYINKKKLEIEIEILRKRCEYLYGELENIPLAIKQFGYVEIKIGGEKVKLGKIE